MEPSPQDRDPSHIKRVLLDYLLGGRGLAVELERFLASALDNPSQDNKPARDLAEKVRISFEQALSALNREVEVDRQRPAQRMKLNGSEGSEGSVHSSLATPRDRRGCYKRRSRGETWTEFAPAMISDCHQWRKYGQKKIHQAEHPRNYFRCTHKTGRGCPATKQVQQVSDDPVTFRTVYQGQHTCNDDRRPKSQVIDGNSSNNPGNGEPQAFLISFERGSEIDAPLKKEVNGGVFFGSKGTAVPSASSNNDDDDVLFSMINGPEGDVSLPSSDLGDITSGGHHGSFTDMMFGWDNDPVYFEFGHGSCGGDEY